ncbi:MAG: hypothetical protein E6K67_06820 [Nitrospirae bacterium]|nr:MAG: hypothetical protein E6K67_06820 [Nitrospirota bacterium]
MEILVAGLMLVLILAYANGANDVSKAVATLVGSGVTNYHTAILWGTIWTMLGAVTAASWATAMLKTFTTGILKGEAASPVAMGFAIITARRHMRSWEDSAEARWRSLVFPASSGSRS